MTIEEKLNIALEFIRSLDNAKTEMPAVLEDHDYYGYSGGNIDDAVELGGTIHKWYTAEDARKILAEIGEQYGIAYTEDGSPTGKVISWKRRGMKDIVWNNIDEALEALDHDGWSGNVLGYPNGTPKPTDI